ncbi:uncharacterized protein LOC127100116 [Lathyrus oleraceus]|uniref:Uncharacterized protein n=1 Tax=Pisum sativum TaxID=3888 RepID=A0A9D5GWW8_PEA|nr:uncharacterized protein LOC127100116 [Pisum sativum]KAI5444092.1 hypothetical protein KIW84_012635 [Pisum sativum]
MRRSVSMLAQEMDQLIFMKKPALKARTGGWKSASLLLVNQGLISLAFSGVEANLVLFSKLVLKQTNVEAASTFSIWMGTTYFLSLIEVFLSDSYLGRYLTCIIFQFVFIIGMVVSVAATLDPATPKPTANLSCTSISYKAKLYLKKITNTPPQASRVLVVVPHSAANPSNGQSGHGSSSQSLKGSVVSVPKTSSATNDILNQENIQPQAAVTATTSPNETVDSITQIDQDKSSSSDQGKSLSSSDQHQISISGVYSPS